ncbi:hypothetical protein LRR18_06315 [Mangrovimonas sp. AS39]|uniref:hypothetical protein n=2 Tax=Mangrovimonas futianensis TaxID=2895523 RepID=UPI001E2F8313|nr:hypothetical protein [Mangrovimonas futianensis]MCF1191195.1 hypothetical protein [Mangrovimonas futianensis]MCF1194890.1 hypothetical protein [Mangrovimonas futianensis]
MKNPKNIKELLQIDIDFLYQNSLFKSDLKTDQNDTRNYLLFDLESKFLDLFDQFQITLFDGNVRHLELISKDINSDKMKKIIELIISQYGADENNQTKSDWNTSKYLSWWFKNSNHQQTIDQPENSDELYYGIVVDGMKNNQLNIVLLDYINIDPKLNNKNWL